MSEYSEDDFEMTSGAASPKPAPAASSNAVKNQRVQQRGKPTSPFRAKEKATTGAYKLEDDENEYDGGYGGKFKSGSGDEYEEDDFDEEE